MWGNFIKSAAALATEQAQSIVGNASQFLERLDGIGATLEDEEGQENAVESESDKASDVDGAVDTHSVSTTSPVERIATTHQSGDHSDADASQSFTSELSTPAVSSVPKKSTKMAKPATPPLPQAAEPAAVLQSSDSLDTLQTAGSKNVDVKKYQARIRKLEKEKGELEQQTSELQLSVATLSKELQSAMSRNPTDDDAQQSEDRQVLLDQVAILTEDKKNAENQFATQLAAVRAQSEQELASVRADYEARIGELKAKFQAQEEELLVLQLNRHHQLKKDEDHADLENKLKDLSMKCKTMLESYQALQHSHDDLSSRYEELYSENSGKDEQIREFQELYDSKVQELEEVRGSIASVPAPAESNDELLALQESYEQLRSQYDVMESDYNALVSRAEQGRASAVQLMDQLREQESRNDELRATLASAEEQLQEQTQRAQQLLADNTQLQGSLTNQERTCHELKMQVENLATSSLPESKQSSDTPDEESDVVAPTKSSGKSQGKKNKKGGKKRGGHEIYSINIGTSDVTEGSAEADEKEVVPVHEAQAVEEKGDHPEELQIKMTSLEMECQDLLSKLDELVDKHQGLQDKYDGKESDYHILIEELNKKEDENNNLYHQFEKLSRDYSALIDQHKELAQKQSQFDRGAGEEAENMKNAFEELQRQHSKYVEKMTALEEMHASTLESFSALQDELYNLKFEQASTLKETEEQDYERRLSALQAENEHFIEQAREKDLHLAQLSEGLEALKSSAQDEDSVVVTNLNSELASVKVSLQSAIASQTTLQEQYDRLLLEKGALRDEIDVATSALAEQRERISELEDINDALQNESTRLQEQCEALEKSLGELQETLGNLEESHRSAGSEKLAALEEQCKLLQAEQLEVQDALLKVSRERDEYRERCEELDTVIDSSKQVSEEHEELSRTYETKVQQLVDELGHFKNHCDEVALSKHLADSKVASLESDLAEAQRALRDAKVYIETVEAEHQKDKIALKELGSQSNGLHADFSAAKQALQQQIIQCDKLSSDYSQAQEKLQLVSSQFQEAKEFASSRYSTLQLQYSQAQEALSQAQSEAASLRGQIAEVLKKSSKLEQDNQYINQQYMNLMSQSSGEAAGLKESIDVLEREKAHAMSQYQQAQLERADLQRKISSLEGELEKFQQQAQSVDSKKKKDLEALKKQNELINSLHQKIFSLEQQLASSSATGPASSSTPETVGGKEHLAQEKLASLQSDFSALQVSSQQQIDQLKEQVQRLTAQVEDLAAEKASLVQQVEVLEKQAQDLNAAFDRAQKAHEEKVTELSTAITKYQTAQQTNKKDPVSDEAVEKVKNLQSIVDMLGREKKAMQQQIEELSQHLTSAYEQSRNSGNVASHSGLSLPGGTYDEESGSMSVEREKKASIGSQVYVVQGWNLIRQNCPGALIHHLPDRPPRLSVAAQVAVVYGLILQMVVVYQYRSCA